MEDQTNRLYALESSPFHSLCQQCLHHLREELVCQISSAVSLGPFGTAPCCSIYYNRNTITYLNEKEMHR